jgi:hypothetical protein
MTDQIQHKGQDRRRRWLTWRRPALIAIAFLLVMWVVIGWVDPFFAADGEGGSRTGHVQP